MKRISTLGVFVLGLSVISAWGIQRAQFVDGTPSTIQTHQKEERRKCAIPPEELLEEIRNIFKKASRDSNPLVFNLLDIDDDIDKDSAYEDNLAIYYRLTNAFGYRMLDGVRVFDVSHRTLVDYAKRKILNYVEEKDRELYEGIKKKLASEPASAVYKEFYDRISGIIGADPKYKSLMVVIDNIDELDNFKKEPVTKVTLLRDLILDKESGIITIDSEEGDFKNAIVDAFDCLILNRSGRHLLEKFLILNELQKLGDDIGFFFKKITIKEGERSLCVPAGSIVKINKDGTKEDQFIMFSSSNDTIRNPIAATLMHELSHQYHYYIRGKTHSELEEVLYGMLSVPSIAESLNPFFNKKFYDDFAMKKSYPLTIPQLNMKSFGYEADAGENFIKLLQKMGYDHLVDLDDKNVANVGRRLASHLCILFCMTWSNCEEALTIAGAAPICYREKDNGELKTFVITDDQSESAILSRGDGKLRMLHAAISSLKKFETVLLKLMKKHKLLLVPEKEKMNDVADRSKEEVTIGFTPEEKNACFQCLLDLSKRKKTILSGNLNLLSKLFSDLKDKTAGLKILNFASQEGRLDIVKYLVEKCKCDANAKDKDGQTPLHEASIGGHLDIVKYLVKNGANVYAKDQFCKTSLAWASQLGHLDIVKYLVKKCHVNVEEKDNAGLTPLHLASENDYLDIVKYLVGECHVNVEEKDNAGRTPLLLASEKGYSDIVKYLSEAVKDEDKLKELFDEIIDGNLTNVKKLIGNKTVNIETQDKHGWTPLHLASFEGYINIVEYLVKNGANVNAKDKDGRTPLHLASFEGYINIVKYLVEHEANVNAKDKDGRTPLYLVASMNGDFAIVKYLVEHEANVNIQNGDGKTPLHLISGKGKLTTAKYLVKHGANVNAKDRDGRTPADVAGTEEIKNYLQKNKGNSQPITLKSLLREAFCMSYLNYTSFNLSVRMFISSY